MSVNQSINQSINLFQIQADPDTGWEINFTKPLDIE
jgi:hypothetical protein